MRECVCVLQTSEFAFSLIKNSKPSSAAIPVPVSSVVTADSPMSPDIVTSKPGNKSSSCHHFDSKQRGAAFSRRLHPSNRWLSDDEDAEEEEDAEVSRLSQSQTMAAVDPLGREQPFTPMVNREMMGLLVRKAFQQTEEQQLQSEQILRHEHGRRSKGEVRDSDADIT